MRTALSCLLILMAGSAHAQALSKLQRAGDRQAAIDVSATAATAGGVAGPAGPLAPPDPRPPIRPDVQCGDFRRVDQGWRAMTAMELPGPRGRIRLTNGQLIAAGAYVDGLDLAGVLQRQCPDAPRLTAADVARLEAAPPPP